MASTAAPNRSSSAARHPDHLALRRTSRSIRRDDLAGIWSARRGTYRVLYRIREDVREVIVLRAEHRRDAYRPL
jgi:mRNA-degrading endonuclease RelE of RelBE toxin-antitoxin system